MNALEKVVDKFKDNSRIKYIEETTANCGRIDMLEICSENCDMPFTLMNHINKSDDLVIYQILAGETGNNPHPIIILTGS